MAGFLDKNDRVIDMVLTGYGRSLLSKNALRFVSWIPMDDEVDYNPFISNSGSLDSMQMSASISQQIEFCPVREATTGNKTLNRIGLETTNGNDTIFTISQGQKIVPQVMTGSLPTALQITIDQNKIADIELRKDASGKTVEILGPVDRGFQRSYPGKKTLEFSYVNGSYPSEHKISGFLVRVFSSGSDGYVEIDPKLDLQGEITYNGELILKGK